MKIFLTGKPGSGKSTVLIKIIDLLKQRGLKVGGIITPEIRKQAKRIGFLVKDLYSKDEGILASVDLKSGQRLGKYKVNLKDFERISLRALDFALKECDLIAIDEIGKMEFFSLRFKEKILEILNSDKKMIACLHRNFVPKFKDFGKIVEVTPENRERLAKEIVKYF